MNCFIWWITEDLIQVIASQIALQTLSKRQKRNQNIQEMFVKIKSQIVKYQKIAAKEKQTSQVNEFNIFSVYGKMQVSGLNGIIHVIFILTIQGPCPVFFVFFFFILNPFRVHHPSGCSGRCLENATAFAYLYGDILYPQIIPNRPCSISGALTPTLTSFQSLSFKLPRERNIM